MLLKTKQLNIGF